MTTTKEYLIYRSGFTVNNKNEALELTPRFKKEIHDRQIYQTWHTMASIKKLALSGRTLNFGLVRAKDRNLLAIDVDNESPSYVMSWQECIRLLALIDIHPNLIMETFSSQNESRYRVIFASKTPILDDEEYKMILRGIISHLNHYYNGSTDFHCTDTGRIFYPCERCLYEDLNAESDLDFSLKLGKLIGAEYLFDLNISKFFATLFYSSKEISKRQYQALLDKNVVYSVFKSEHENRPYYSIISNILIEDGYFKREKGISEEPQWGNEKFYKSLKTQITPLFTDTFMLKKFDSIQINRWKISFLLGQEQKSFPDILSNDKNLVDEFIEKKDGTERYLIFRREANKLVFVKSYSIVDLFQLVFGIGSFKDTMSFIRKLCNVEDERYLNKTRLKKSYTCYEKALQNLEKYPNLNTLLCSRDNNSTKSILFAILHMAQKDLEKFNSDIIPPPQIMANADKIKKILQEKMPEAAKSSPTIRKKIIILEKLGLISKVPNEDINEYYANKIQSYKAKGYVMKANTIYIVPYFTTKILTEAEKNAKAMLKSSTSNYKSLSFSSEDTIKKSPYYTEMVRYIKSSFDSNAKYVAQIDLKNYLATCYPDKKDQDIQAIIRKYKAHLLTELELKEKILTKHNMWMFGLNTETVKAHHYHFDKSKIFHKPLPKLSKGLNASVI